MYPFLVLGSLICIKSGFNLIIVRSNSNLGSFMSGMSTIKGGKYILATGVVVIINDNTNDTNNNNNKVMVNVGNSNSDGNNSKDTTT